MAAQVVGAVAGAGVLLVIANGRPDFASDGNFLAANGFGADGSPEGYGLLAALATEVVLTFGFLLVILEPPTIGPIPPQPASPSASPSR